MKYHMEVSLHLSLPVEPEMMFGNCCWAAASDRRGKQALLACHAYLPAVVLINKNSQ